MGGRSREGYLYEVTTVANPSATASEPQLQIPVYHNIDMLTKLQSLFTPTIQLRASFNFISFRTCIYLILVLCKERCWAVGVRMSPEYLSKPEELAYYAHAFFLALE